jgi:hypothetical protein
VVARIDFQQAKTQDTAVAALSESTLSVPFGHEDLAANTTNKHQSKPRLYLHTLFAVRDFVDCQILSYHGNDGTTMGPWLQKYHPKIICHMPNSNP